MKVKPGSKIEYWLTVRDTKEPQSNRFETARQIIQVIAPLPPREKKAADEQARKEQEDAQSGDEPANPAEAHDQQPNRPDQGDAGEPDRAEADQPERTSGDGGRARSRWCRGRSR